MVTKVVEWVIDITPQNEELYTAESILNTRSEEFSSFMSSVIRMLEASGYELNDNYNSNKNDSNSVYYEFLKFDESVIEIKLILFVRISDHKPPDRVVDGKNTTGSQRRQKYHTDTRLPQIMKDFNCTKLPIAVDVDILFDGNHFICYEDVLKYIHDRIEKLED